MLRVKPLYNPVWRAPFDLRDPAVLPDRDGYLLFFSRYRGKAWDEPKSWSVGCAFTRDFLTFADDHDVTPCGYASPGDPTMWHGRLVLPYQTYPLPPARLCYATSPDGGRHWSTPTIFLDQAGALAWNLHGRAIDPSLVVDGDALHCFFIGSADVRGTRANLLGHATCRDPNMAEWNILTVDKPLLGASERAPDGVENVMVFRTGGEWTMIYSEGLRQQHLALARSPDLVRWTFDGVIPLPEQEWMARQHGAPFVWCEGDVYWMVLMGEDAENRTTFGLLRSEDGRHWIPLPERDKDGRDLS